MSSLAIGLGVSAAASLGSAAIGSHAATSAAKTQAGAADFAASLEHQDAQQALAFQEQQYRNSLGLLQPYYNTGTQSLGILAQLMGMSPSAANTSVFSDPLGNNPQGFNQQANPWMTPEAQLTVPNPTAMNAQGMVRNINGQPMPTPSGGFRLPGGAGIRPMLATADGLVPPPDQQDRTIFDGGPLPPDTTGAGTATPPTGVTPGTGTQGIETINGPTLPNGLPVGFLTQPWTEQFKNPVLSETTDPGYLARLKLGTEAIQNSAASRGGLLSGNTATALNQFGQDYASNEYGNVYNRAMTNYLTRYNQFKQNQADIFNRYADIAGLGQTSASTLSNAGLNTGQGIANTLLTSGAQIGQQINNAGAARASGYIGSANAIGGGLQGLGNLGLLYSLLKSGGGAGANPFAGSSAFADGFSG